ncbi:MAG TPA: hypothetical protein VJQ77_03875 [Novosphingobium sp.]|nr:hypothetical protein [Novosphingobium sp.]
MRVSESVRALGLTGFGLLSTGAAILCIAIAPHEALTGWLAAAVMVQAVPLGGLVLLAMMRLIPGPWEEELRFPCEAAAGLWVLAALAFLPVLIGVGVIYDWPGASPGTAFQEVWLGLLPFALRTLLWFVALALIARSQVGGRASQGASALALVVMTFGTSLLAVDWLMSIGTQFNSSGFGLQVFALEMCVAYTVIVLLRLIHPPAPRSPGVLGALLLLFLLVWVYFQSMPYLVIWSGNLPDGAQWYLDRSYGGWVWALYAIGALGFLPLLALLLPQVRGSPRALAYAAIFALAGKVLEFAWFAVPGRGGMAVLAYLFALGGLGAFATAFLWPGWTWWPPGRRTAA